MKFNNYILRKKVLFYFHLANLPQTSLGRIVLDIQEANNTEGQTLKKEVEEHISAMGFTNLREVSKGVFRRKVNKYFHDKQRAELLEDIKNYKKLDYEELSKEPFERKEFVYTLSLENARMRYKLLSKVVPTVRGHFPQKYRKTSLECPACRRGRQSDSPPPSLTSLSRHSQVSSEETPTDTSSHILLVCDNYADLKDETFDPSDDKKLSEFFRLVVKRRIESGDI